MEICVKEFFLFIKKNCSNKIPKPGMLKEVDKNLLAQLTNKLPHLIDLMNNQNLNEFLRLVISYSFDANKYFNDSEPWKVKKDDPVRMNTILYTACVQIKNLSILLNPVIPDSTNKILETMNLKKIDISLNEINNLNCFNHNLELKKLEILFKKIENDN